MDESKLQGILKIVVDYGLPLMEQGTKVTKNPYDNYVVALLKGGLPAVVAELENTPTDAPAK